MAVKKITWLLNVLPPSGKNFFSYSIFEVSGHQRPYLAEIYENGCVCGQQGPYFTKIQSNNHDIF